MANIVYRGATAPTAANTAANKNAALTNDEIDKNFFALNAGPTIGTTTISPGTTSLTLAGLTSVTATSFIGTSLTTFGDVTVGGNLVVNGITTTINSSTLAVDDKNIELGSVVALSNLSGNIATTALSTVVNMSSTAGIIPGMVLTRVSGAGAFGTAATVTSVVSAIEITVTATTTNTSGAIVFNVGGVTDTTANGGGITLKGNGDKTIIWDSANSNWTSSENWNIATGKVFKINNASILSSTTLGTTVVNSSLTKLGTGAGLVKSDASGNLTVDATAYYSSSNVPPYPAEADTLATVTARGATTSTASTFSGGLSASTGTFTAGTVSVTGTVGISNAAELTLKSAPTAFSSIRIFTSDPVNGFYGYRSGIQSGVDGGNGHGLDIWNGDYRTASFTSTGFGIKTTAPAKPLHVIGDVRFEAFMGTTPAEDVTQEFVTSVGTQSIKASGNTLSFATDSTERLRITGTGAWGLAGAANYGTIGQILTSQGNAAPVWAPAPTSGTSATLNNDTTTDTTQYIGMSRATSGAWASAYVASTKLTFNPSTGVLNSTGFNSLSDARAKSDIQLISNALNKTLALNGYTFFLNSNKDKRQTGVIAQEVLKVLPEAVSGTEDTQYSVSYGSMMGLMIEAIKELNAKVTDLQNQLANK